MLRDVPSPCKAGTGPHQMSYRGIPTNGAYRQHCKGLPVAENQGSEGHARMAHFAVYRLVIPAISWPVFSVELIQPSRSRGRALWIAKRHSKFEVTHQAVKLVEAIQVVDTLLFILGESLRNWKALLFHEVVRQSNNPVVRINPSP